MMVLFDKNNKDSPSYFFILLISHGLLSIIVIIVLAGFGLRNTYRNQVFTEAGRDAERIVAAIIHLEEEFIFAKSPPDGWRIHVAYNQLPMLDRRLSLLLEIFDISKIKIFDQETRVVYSSDAAIIGQLDINNQRLARALTGQIDSSLKQKETMADLADEEGFTMDMVETYVPVIDANDQVIGVIELYIDVTHYRQIISSMVHRNLSILATVLLLVFSAMLLMVRALTKRLAMTQGQLKKLASIDSLTGVLTRREIMERGKSAGLKPPKRRETEDKEDSNGLMMLDIDLFKKINDTHGHMIGDLVLKIIAQRLTTSVRDQDVIGRFGGEEFLIILPNSSLKTTELLAERCRKVVSDTPISCQGVEIPVTASIGISCFSVDRGETAFLQALDAADKALYRAKENGRNQTRSQSYTTEPVTFQQCNELRSCP